MDEKSDSYIEIKKVPKLGSLSETANLIKKSMIESMKYQKSLSKETGSTFLKTTWKSIRFAGKVKSCIQSGEDFLALPDIIVENRKYWAFMYAPKILKVGRLGFAPKGYTIFDDKNSVLNNPELAAKVAHFYRIWEELYIRPYKVSLEIQTPTILNWLLEFENKFYEEIMDRKKTNYEGFDGTPEELTVLRELDQQVIDFHQVRVNSINLDRQLGSIIFEIFEHPSDTNILKFMQLTYTFKEAAQKEKLFLQERLKTWTTYRTMLERKYNVKFNLELNMGEIGFGALIDLMKYLLWQHVIPEATLSAVSYDVIKDIIKTKGLQVILNLMIHYGGIVSLQKAIDADMEVLASVENYIDLWESKSEANMIRLP